MNMTIIDKQMVDLQGISYPKRFLRASTSLDDQCCKPGYKVDFASWHIKWLWPKTLHCDMDVRSGFGDYSGRPRITTPILVAPSNSTRIPAYPGTHIRDATCGAAAGPPCRLLRPPQVA